MAEDRIIRTHNKMIAIYDEFIKKFEKKYGINLSYSETSKMIAERIILAGGINI